MGEKMEILRTAYLPEEWYLVLYECTNCGKEIYTQEQQDKPSYCPWCGEKDGD